MGYTSYMPRGVYEHKPENYPPSRKGTKLTDAHRHKLAESLKGNTWNRGRTHSEESTRLKSKNSARYWLGKKRGPQSEETIRKRSESLRGHRVSETTRERMGTLTKGKFGKDHPCWAEEKKRPLYKAIREIYKYKDWRMAIFTRDNFTCVLCQTKGYVEADHYPIRFVDILRKNGIENIEDAVNCEDLWDNSNGRTLCKPCHLQTITWGRKPGF